MKKILVIFMVLGVFFCTQAHAADPFAGKNDLPVKINADDMEYDINRSQVTFTGNVVVVRGDFRMTAPKMTIFLKQTAQKTQVDVSHENIPLTGKAEKNTQSVATQNKIEKIEAYGGVRFKFETQSGKSQTATYNAAKGVLTMKGNPEVQDGSNSIKGDTILYYLYERRSEVVGSGKKRVEAIFEPNK